MKNEALNKRQLERKLKQEKLFNEFVLSLNETEALELLKRRKKKAMDDEDSISKILSE
jgi:hypothetical protein